MSMASTYSVVSTQMRRTWFEVMVDALAAGKYHRTLDHHGESIAYARCVATRQSYTTHGKHCAVYHSNISQTIT